MPILTILLVIIISGVLLWLVNTYIPMDRKIKTMKRKSFYSVVLITGFMVANFSVNHMHGQTQKTTTNQQPISQYSCSMHPDVIRDKPGNCPKCGMKLTEKKSEMVRTKYQVKDSSALKLDHEKMKGDSSKIKKHSTMNDSTMMKKTHKKTDSTLYDKPIMKK